MVEPAALTFDDGDIGRLSPTAEVPEIAFVAINQLESHVYQYDSH